MEIIRKKKKKKKVNILITASGLPMLWLLLKNK